MTKLLRPHQLQVGQSLQPRGRAKVRERLGGYVRLPIAERRDAVAELAEEGLSQREIAAVVGASVGTVNADLGVQNRTDGVEKSRGEARESLADVQNRTELDGDDGTGWDDGNPELPSTTGWEPAPVTPPPGRGAATAPGPHPPPASAAQAAR